MSWRRPSGATIPILSPGAQVSLDPMCISTNLRTPMGWSDIYRSIFSSVPITPRNHSMKCHPNRRWMSSWGLLVKNSRKNTRSGLRSRGWPRYGSIPRCWTVFTGNWPLSSRNRRNILKTTTWLSRRFSRFPPLTTRTRRKAVARGEKSKRKRRRWNNTTREKIRGPSFPRSRISSRCYLLGRSRQVTCPT